MNLADLFGLSDRRRRLSATDDPLEILERVVDFEKFRSSLDAALGYSDHAKEGWLSSVGSGGKAIRLPCQVEMSRS